ncbi:MAG: YybH family protein [Gammaproteobacteria bacterium]
MNRSLFLSTMVILFWCCQAAADDLASTGTAWQDAFDTGDAAQVANVYSQDGRLLPPHGEPVVGREAIQAFWAGLLESGAHIQTELEELGEEGPLGFRMGSFTVKDSDGNVIDDGQFVEIWRKRDGHWWFDIDIWNSNRPLPAQ